MTHEENENNKINESTDFENQQPQEKPKHAGGRPRILQSIEYAETLINSYFASNPQRPTICGLARHLGFVDRSSMYDYIGRGDEISYTIKSAVNRIEEEHEKRMFEEKPSGSIFWLKNRGWKDSHDITSDGKPIKPTSVDFSALVSAGQQIAQQEGQEETPDVNSG